MKFTGEFNSRTTDYGDIFATIGDECFCEHIYEEGGTQDVYINGKLIATGLLSGSAGYCYSSWTHCSDTLTVCSNYPTGVEWIDIVKYLCDNYEGQEVTLETIPCES